MAGTPNEHNEPAEFGYVASAARAITFYFFPSADCSRIIERGEKLLAECDRTEEKFQQQMQAISSSR